MNENEKKVFNILHKAGEKIEFDTYAEQSHWVTEQFQAILNLMREEAASPTPGIDYVAYERRVNLGNYEHATLRVSMKLGLRDDTSEKVEALMDYVNDTADRRRPGYTGVGEPKPPTWDDVEGQEGVAFTDPAGW